MVDLKTYIESLDEKTIRESDDAFQEAVLRAHHLFQMTDREMARFLDAGASTICRWRNGEAHQLPSMRKHTVRALKRKANALLRREQKSPAPTT